MRVLGVDLAWAEGSKAKAANETGVAAVDCAGYVLDAGWTVGLEATVSWVSRWQSDDTLLFVDAPLVVTNPRGQRRCERDVGRCYGRWKVSANSTNLGSRRLAGVTLRQTLERSGWIYHDGRYGPPADGKVISECYPYTTIVGAYELGFHDERRQPSCRALMTAAVSAPTVDTSRTDPAAVTQGPCLVRPRRFRQSDEFG